MHSSRHFVPTKFLQRATAFRKRAHNRTILYAPSAPFSCTAFIETDNNRRPIIFFRDSRCYDPENSGMPAPRTQDNSGVTRWIKVFPNLLFRLLKNLLFNFLTLPILIVQFASEFGRLNRIISQEQA